MILYSLIYLRKHYLHFAQNRLLVKSLNQILCEYKG